MSNKHSEVAVEPDNLPAGLLAGVVGAMVVIVIGFVFFAWIFTGWMTQRLQEERNSVEPTALIEVMAAQGAVLAGEATIEVEGNVVQPISIDEAMELVVAEPERFGLGTAR